MTALKNVEIFGIPEQQVKVDLNLSKMAQLHIPLDAVLNVLQNEIANIPGGSAQEGARSFNVKTSGNYKDEQEVANTIIYSVNRKNILLKDIANVYKDFETTTHITRLNGHRAVFVAQPQPLEQAARRIVAPEHVAGAQRDHREVARVDRLASGPDQPCGAGVHLDPGDDLGDLQGLGHIVVGVQAEETVTLYRLDEDYFESL